MYRKKIRSLTILFPAPCCILHVFRGEPRHLVHSTAPVIMGFLHSTIARSDKSGVGESGEKIPRGIVPISSEL